MGDRVRQCQLEGDNQREWRLAGELAPPGRLLVHGRHTEISGSGSTGLLEYTGPVNIPWGGPVYITVEISSPSLNVGSDTHAGLAPTYKGNTSSNPGTPCVRLHCQSTGAAQWASMGSSARGSVAEALGTNTYYRIGMLMSNGEWTATFQGSIPGSASTAGPGSGSGQVAALQLYTCNVTAKFMSIHIWVPTAMANLPE